MKTKYSRLRINSGLIGILSILSFSAIFIQYNDLFQQNSYTNEQNEKQISPKPAILDDIFLFDHKYTYDLTLEFRPGEFETNETIYAPGSANLSLSKTELSGYWEYQLNYSVILDHPYEIIPIFLYNRDNFNETFRVNYTEIYMYVRGVYGNQMYLNLQHVDHTRNLTHEELFCGNVSIFPEQELECVQFGFEYELTYLQDPNDPDYLGPKMMSGYGKGGRISFYTGERYPDEFDVHVSSFENLTAETHVTINEWNVDAHLEIINSSISEDERWYNSTVGHTSDFGLPIQQGTAYLLDVGELRKSGGGLRYGNNPDGNWMNQYIYTLPSGEFWRDYEMKVNYTGDQRDYLMIWHCYELQYAFDFSYRLVSFIIVDDIAYEQFLKTLPLDEELPPEEPRLKIPGFSIIPLLCFLSIGIVSLVLKSAWRIQ